MATPILEISDGVTSINLLDPNGVMVNAWNPAITDLKNGGIWQDSPMADGRRLVIQHFENVVETLAITIGGGSQDTVIENSQKLRRLLQQARDYWSSDRNDVRPVYVKARAPYETNTRYALIYDWKTSNDNNPLTMPFFACGESAMVSITLVFERGHWMSDAPLSSTCVQISNIQDYEEAGASTGALLSDTSTLTIFADGYNETCGMNYYSNNYYATGNADTPNFWFGLDQSVFDYFDFEMAFRFRAVNVPPHVVIDNAYVTLVAYENSTALTQAARIYAEKRKNPPYFDSCPLNHPGACTPMKDRYYTSGDRDAVPLTENFVDWNIPQLTAGNSYNSDDLTSIIQEMVDAPFWESGDDLVIYFKSNDNDDLGENAKEFTMAGNYPVLTIEYHVKEDAVYGQTNTCDAGAVIVANTHHRANLSHIYRYDASGASYSINLTGGGLPFDILPATPAVNDLVYFGIDITLENSGPFCNIVFDIGEIADDTHGVWEYYNGASWTELSVTDNTVDLVYEDAFTVLGVNSVHWIHPDDWSVVAINSVTAYWVRFKVTSVDAAPDAPTQQNRLPYSVVTPFVDIDAAQVGGDIAALSAIYVQNVSDDFSGDVKLQAKRVICALRSLDRGTGFSPYINFGGQNIVPVVINPVDTEFTLDSTITSPTGGIGRFTPSAAFTLSDVAEILFQGDELTNYIGTFRAFLRTREYDATSDKITAQLSMQFGESTPNFYTKEVEIDSVGYYSTLTDMGLFTIQPGTLNPSETYVGGKITLYLSSDSSDGTDLHILELILMPADEWFCDTRSKTNEALRMFGWHGEQRELRIDAIGNPRFETRSILVDDPGTGRALDTWEIITSSPPILQANKDQRLWFLVQDTDRDIANICAFEACHAVRVFKSQRYFSMRGSR